MAVVLNSVQTMNYHRSKIGVPLASVFLVHHVNRKPMCPVQGVHVIIIDVTNAIVFHQVLM